MCDHPVETKIQKLHFFTSVSVIKTISTYFADNQCYDNNVWINTNVTVDTILSPRRLKKCINSPVPRAGNATDLMHNCSALTRTLAIIVVKSNRAFM